MEVILDPKISIRSASKFDNLRKNQNGKKLSTQTLKALLFHDQNRNGTLFENLRPSIMHCVMICKNILV